MPTDKAQPFQVTSNKLYAVACLYTTFSACIITGIEGDTLCKLNWAMSIIIKMMWVLTQVPVGRGGGSNIFASVVERLEAGLAVKSGPTYKHIAVAHVSVVVVQIKYCMSGRCPHNSKLLVLLSATLME
jgi:hypothetical protein